MMTPMVDHTVYDAAPRAWPDKREVVVGQHEQVKLV